MIKKVKVFAYYDKQAKKLIDFAMPVKDFTQFALLVRNTEKNQLKKIADKKNYKIVKAELVYKS